MADSFFSPHPLYWPIDWGNIGNFEKVLLDVPWLGLKSRVKRAVQAQIDSRTRIDFNRSWNGKSEFFCYRDCVLEIINDYMDWHSFLFIPDDPCEIMFWSLGDGMSTVSAIDSLEEKCKLSDIFTLIYSKKVTFIELLKVIKRFQEEDMSNP